MKLALPGSSQRTVFAPVESQTAFEETLERLGTAIKLGLLEPGERLPAERELCRQLGISRSTLRQALTALVQSGHLTAARGRSGGTFVADLAAARRPALAPSCSRAGATPATSGSPSSSPSRCSPPSGRSAAALAPLDALVDAMDAALEDFPAFRPRRRALAHRARRGDRQRPARGRDDRGPGRDERPDRAHRPPAELLAWTNQQHGRMVAAVRRGDGDRAMRIMAEHLKGTEHVLAGLLPSA